MSDFDGQRDDAGSHTELQVVRHDFTTQTELNADKINAIAARLDALPARQQTTLADAVKVLAPTVKRLRDRGYSIGEVAAELTASGVKISGRTLSRLLANNKPAKRNATGRA